ncbi:2Fe-2S iron-sulfur cluster binding domain-containing protein [soil metagenome]
MADKHIVRFEPVGIEIEVDETQTVLRAAAEQGIMLMHGCKEGQCAACKSFLLEGEDVEHDSYSTFALPDSEKDEGFTLLCRAHVYEDVTIELLNYDEEMIRSGLPIQSAVTTVVANDNVTHDLRHLVLALPADAEEFRFFPGQYVDIGIPGTEDSRSFSMANVTAKDDGRLEFIIKCYPGGRFSEYLDTRVLVGDELPITGPFGVFTLRDSPAELVFVGGGAGMAPILSVLRSLAERDPARKATFYYGARAKRDLCFEPEFRQLEQLLANFTYVPALSAPVDGEPWGGEVGFVTDVVRKHETDLRRTDAYVCGPPPMVEAAITVLSDLGAPESRIFSDKFTTTGESETTPVTGRASA